MTLEPFADPKISQVSTLLQKMAGDRPKELKFTKAQVNAWIEVAVKQMVTELPGLPLGMKCQLDKLDEDTWNLRITRPPHLG